MTTSNDPDQIRRQIDATREDLAGNVDLLEEKVSPSRIVDRRVGRVKDAAGTLRERVMGSVHSGGSTASDSAHHAADSTRSALSSASDAVTSAPSTVTQQTRGNPLAAGVVAFGIGLLLGSVFAPTEAEREVAAEARDQAQPLLTESAKSIAQEVKEPAQQAVQQVKETATGAVQDVAEQAKSHAADVKDEAQDAAHDVKDHATH